jgi:hypothetical protein
LVSFWGLEKINEINLGGQLSLLKTISNSITGWGIEKNGTITFLSLNSSLII